LRTPVLAIRIVSRKKAPDFESCARADDPVIAPANSSCAVQELLDTWWGVTMMSLVRLLGFTTLGCGCVTGRYREVATNREITYVEEKGAGCSQHAHRRNHTIAPARGAVYALSAKAS
jgi:hypothetical protein